jgi:hypothetical protein
VYAADYTIWRDALDSMTNLAADGNQNGGIDAGDYDVWKMHFGSGAGAAAPVPEPATASILFIGIVLLCLDLSRGTRTIRRATFTKLPFCDDAGNSGNAVLFSFS